MIQSDSRTFVVFFWKDFPVVTPKPIRSATTQGVRQDVTPASLLSINIRCSVSELLPHPTGWPSATAATHKLLISP